jgi:hypothetical protein
MRSFFYSDTNVLSQFKRLETNHWSAWRRLRTTKTRNANADAGSKISIVIPERDAAEFWMARIIPKKSLAKQAPRISKKKKWS